MEFPNWLLKKLRVTFPSKWRTPEPYSDIKHFELVARFLTDKREFSRQEKVVKPSAFIPREIDQLKLSVTRIYHLVPEAIIKIDKEISPHRKSSLKGFAKITVSNIIDCDVKIEPDLTNNAHVRHAVITGFTPSPDSAGYFESIELAKRAELILTPKAA